MATRFFSTYNLKEGNLASNLASSTTWTKSTISSMILSKHFEVHACAVQSTGLGTSTFHRTLRITSKVSIFDDDEITNGLAEELPN
jgi:hypothetical protein